MVENIASALDLIASDLELLGLSKLAAAVDSVSNTLEDARFNNAKENPGFKGALFTGTTFSPTSGARRVWDGAAGTGRFVKGDGYLMVEVQERLIPTKSALNLLVFSGSVRIKNGPRSGATIDYENGKEESDGDSAGSRPSKDEYHKSTEDYIMPPTLQNLLSLYQKLASVLWENTEGNTMAYVSRQESGDAGHEVHTRLGDSLEKAGVPREALPWSLQDMQALARAPAGDFRKRLYGSVKKFMERLTEEKLQGWLSKYPRAWQSLAKDKILLHALAYPLIDQSSLIKAGNLFPLPVAQDNMHLEADSSLDDIVAYRSPNGQQYRVVTGKGVPGKSGGANPVLYLDLPGGTRRYWYALRGSLKGEVQRKGGTWEKIPQGGL
jgi:hypothetical protein